MEQLTGAVLAGGNSRRMGANKALLTIGGEALVERIITVLNYEMDRVLLVTNNPDQYSFLRTEKIMDRFRGAGPLAGLDAAFAAVSDGWVFLSACDLPFPDQRAVHAMIQAAKKAETEAVVPKINGVQHPLFAVYHSSLRLKVEEKLENDDLRMADLLAEANVFYPDESFFHNIGMSSEDISLAFYNMNHPEDYNWAQKQ